MESFAVTSTSSVRSDILSLNTLCRLRVGLNLMGASERPTLTPPFDPAAFARESESKLRISVPTPVDPKSSGTLRRAEAHVTPLQREEFAFDHSDRITSELPLPPSVRLTTQSVPVLAMAATQMRGMQLDHRAGFILSHVDGVSSVETILDVSGMQSDEVLLLLQALVDKGIITAR